MHWTSTTVTIDLSQDDGTKIAHLMVNYRSGLKEWKLGDPDGWSPAEPDELEIINGYWDANDLPLSLEELKNVEQNHYDEVLAMATGEM